MTGAVIFDSELKLDHHRSGADQLLDIVVGYSLVVDVTVDGLYTSLARNTFMIGKGGHDGSIKAGLDASCHLVIYRYARGMMALSARLTTPSHKS
jgi:hypothetical protein